MPVRGKLIHFFQTIRETYQRSTTESVNPMLLAKDYVIFSPNNNENKR